MYVGEREQQDCKISATTFSELARLDQDSIGLRVRVWLVNDLSLHATFRLRLGSPGDYALGLSLFIRHY